MEAIGTDSSFKVGIRKKRFPTWRRFTLTEFGQKWPRSIEFIFTCVVACGLGHIWRFPYTAYRNGGGAFLFSYIIVIIFVGRPLLYLESSMGQFVGKRPVKMWNVVPALRGIGVGQVFIALSSMSYLNFIISVVLYYFFKSFKPNIPWGLCEAEWDECVDSVKVFPDNQSLENGRSSSDFYFRDVLINEINSIDDGIGVPSVPLTLNLLGLWILLGVLLGRGLNCVGKLSYFAVILPYIMFTIMLISTTRLPGAKDGIKFLFSPKWSECLNPEVWYAAVIQAFFSLNISFGPIIYLSSYCEFNHNLNRDLWIITTMDILLSLMASVTAFSTLGNIAYVNKKDISTVLQKGLSFTLIIYPDALAKFSNQPGLVSALFFLMILAVGIGGIMVIMGLFMTVILDNYPRLQIWHVTLIGSVIGFLSGIVYLTPGGLFLLKLVDYYAVAGVMYFLAIFQLIGITWIYGLENFCKDITYMTKRKVHIFWRLCLGLITPLFLIIILICYYSVSSTVTYQGINYPKIATVIGNLLTVLGVLPVFTWMFIEIYKHRDNPFKKMVKLAFTPNAIHGPEDVYQTFEWRMHLQFIQGENWSDMSMKKKLIYGLKVLFGMIKDDNFDDMEESEEQSCVDLDCYGSEEGNETKVNERSEQIEMQNLDEKNIENK